MCQAKPAFILDIILWDLRVASQIKSTYKYIFMQSNTYSHDESLGDKFWRPVFSYKTKIKNDIFDVLGPYLNKLNTDFRLISLDQVTYCDKNRYSENVRNIVIYFLGHITHP